MTVRRSGQRVLTPPAVAILGNEVTHVQFGFDAGTRTVAFRPAPKATNAHGNHLGYELIPSVRGVARHNGADERFTERGLWVTAWNRHETGYTAPNDWHCNGEVLSDTFLVEAAGQGGKNGPESVVDTDLVVWYKAGEHHDPRDEDRSPVDPGPEPEGVTLVHWLGFDLVPHNLFDHNPLSGPHGTECGQAP